MATKSDNKFCWEGRHWKREMEILDAFLANPNAPRNFINSKPYSQAYITGLIGEKKARKWLKENGYEVYEFDDFMTNFECIDSYASRILKILPSMRRRRKQEYIQQDKQFIDTCKQNIVKQVNYLKETYSEKYFVLRHLFADIHKLRENIRHTKKKRRGSRQPDFIVKKGNMFAFVEVKANTSNLVTEQRGCFKLAKSYGFNALTLKVTVESNVAKDIRFLDYIGRIGSIEKPQDLKINQYEAIIEAFNVLGGARTADEIKEWVTNKYGSVWKDFSTPMSKMVPSHLYSNCPKKYRALTRLHRGVYAVIGTVSEQQKHPLHQGFYNRRELKLS